MASTSEISSLITVPVLVDDSGVESEYPFPIATPLVRCIYFAFEASPSARRWQLTISGRTMPFLMLGLTGIIYGTASANGINGQPFSSPADIETTFEFIEADEQIIIDTGRIYLPVDFVNNAISPRTPKVHDSLRVRQDLLTLAIQFAENRIAIQEFQQALDIFQPTTISPGLGAPAPIAFSDQETIAFAEWASKQFDEARRRESIWRSDKELHSSEERRNRPF